MIKSQGYVVGHMWGGGIGKYPARILIHDTIEALEKELNESKDIGEFDGGMGFDRVFAVLYEPEETVYEGDWKKSRTLEPIIIDKFTTDEEKKIVGHFDLYELEDTGI